MSLEGITTTSRKNDCSGITSLNKTIILVSIVALVVGAILASLGLCQFFGTPFSDGYTLSIHFGGFLSSAGLAGLLILAIRQCLRHRNSAIVGQNG